MENNSATLDRLFHALADPTRRTVVQQLGRRPAAVSELARQFDMALPSFMKHVAVLEGAGLIDTRKVGRVRSCTLNPERLADAEKWFGAQRELWERRYERLDTLLATLTGEEVEN